MHSNNQGGTWSDWDDGLRAPRLGAGPERRIPTRADTSASLAARQGLATSLKGAAYLRILVLGGLDASGSHELIRVFVPGTIREIVTEHGSGGLRLVQNAKGDVGLSQA